MTTVLAYWDIRGLVQPIRLLLNHVGQDFEDKKYSCGPAPEFNRDCWLNEKFNLGLDFPNLPYYIDGDVKLSQTNAILRYLGRKHDLYGTTDKEKARIDLLAEQTIDLRMGLIRLCYNKEFENLKPDYLKNLSKNLKSYEEFLGDNKWFAGDKLSFVDFSMYEILDQHRALSPEYLNDFPKLQAFVKNFEELPKVKSYMASDKFMKSPINNKMAKFGNV